LPRWMQGEAWRKSCRHGGETCGPVQPVRDGSPTGNGGAEVMRKRRIRSAGFSSCARSCSPAVDGERVPHIPSGNPHTDPQLRRPGPSTVAGPEVAVATLSTDRARCREHQEPGVDGRRNKTTIPKSTGPIIIFQFLSFSLREGRRRQGNVGMTRCRTI
jgi:hypothetical protein